MQLQMDKRQLCPCNKIIYRIVQWGNYNFNPHYASIQCSMQLIVKMKEVKMNTHISTVQLYVSFYVRSCVCACVYLCMYELRSRLFMYLKLFCSSNIKWDNKYDFTVVLSINWGSEHKINEKATLSINSWYLLTKYVNRAFVWNVRSLNSNFNFRLKWYTESHFMRSVIFM